MTDKDKVIEYELQIEDMLHAIRDRLRELKEQWPLNEFEQGRYLAFTEMLEIIQTRHQMIWAVCSDD